MVAVSHKIVHGWCDLPAKCVVLFRGDTDRNLHGAEFITVS
jgi:hypothetical protein